MVLPENLSDSLIAKEPATVEVFYDTADSTSAGAGLGMVREMLNEANLALSGASRLLLMEEKSVQTDPLRPIDSQLPGMLGIALLWLGLFGTAMPVVQQRETLVLRRLSVTPLTPARMLAAQVAWRVTVGLFQAALFLLVGYLAFGIGIQGNKLLFAATVVLGTLVFVSLGYLMAGLASSEEGVMAMVQIVNFPMMFLSGGLMPVESLPAYFKPVVNVMPLSYLTDALQQLMAGATPLHPLWLDLAVMAGWLAVFLALATKLWRWE
jgi:ABC-2 type transport system permease protein